MPFLFFWRSGFFLHTGGTAGFHREPAVVLSGVPASASLLRSSCPSAASASFLLPGCLPIPGLFSVPLRNAPSSLPPRFSPLRGLTLPLLLEAQPLKPGSSQAGRNCHTDSILLTQNPWRIDDRKRRTYRKNNKRLHGSS